ncbi:hypothetical protein BDV96DRAFT_595429 [Lophiotrema nucula]|uniref:Killer toxin Kp4 domain-containing protein n=1 Tax=Lophiotrema nucula TaxID=690887 RepID=A0A6A5ZNP9_9PLEO|nr:hypothetical protein BDV96DRAFT_595429 [Lophiotrema nucula]
MKLLTLLVAAAALACAVALPADSSDLTEPYDPSSTFDAEYAIDTSTSEPTFFAAADGGHEGINCKGSSLCKRIKTDIHAVQQIIDWNVKDDDEFQAGKSIACKEGVIDLSKHGHGLCVIIANLNGRAGVMGKVVKQRIRDIINNKCDKCGSAPIYEGRNTDIGEVKVDYVSKICSDGMCK